MSPGAGNKVMADPPPRLQDGYYLKNFLVILDTVQNRYGDLLLPAESSFIETFKSLAETSQRLYVRLLSRKGPLFRSDRLKYWDIPNISTAAEVLLDVGFFAGGSDSPAEEWLKLLVVPELRQMAQEHWKIPIKGSVKRSALVSAVLEGADGPQITATINELFAIYQPLHSQIIVLFRLLFFGNLQKDLTDFVLQDLGVLKFEKYLLTHEHRLFPDRQSVEECFDLLQHVHLIQVLLYESQIDEAEVLGQAIKVKAGDYSGRNQRIAHRAFNNLGRDLERAKRLGLALEYFQLSKVPPARERRVRILFQQGLLDDARILCQAIQEDAQDETELEFAPRFLRKIHKKQGQKLAPEKRKSRQTVALFLIRDSSLNIETQVLNALAEQQREGYHCENGLWLTLFGLSFWEVIYTPIPGAFEHPFQYGPLDLHETSFRKDRDALVQSRLAFLRTAEPSDLAQALLKTYDHKFGLANSFVSWDSWSREELERVIEAIGGSKLSLIFDRLSRDIRRYRRGFPDLFLFTKSGFELYEVKGPGDQLRPEQRSWLDFFAKNGIEAFVARVEWIDR
jgi:hypothetical protein